MTGLIDWAASRARMVIAFVILSLTVGAAAYVGLPKEGEPDIDIPGLFVSVPFPGISAEDSERLLVKPMESEFQDLDGLTTITSPPPKAMPASSSSSSSAGTSPPPSPMCATPWAAPRRSSRGRRKLVDQRNQLLGIPDHRRGALGRRARTHADPARQRDAGRAGRAVAGARGGSRRHARRDARGHPRPPRARGLRRHGAGPDQRGRQQQPADRGGRRGDVLGRDLGQDPVELRHGGGCLQPADHQQWRPGRDAGRTGRYPPDLPGPHRHGALQRRDHGRAAGGQAQGFNVIDTADLVRETVEEVRAGDLAAGAARQRPGRHHARPVGAGRRHGPPARGLGPDGHRAGDDRGAGRARHPLGACWWASRSRPRSCCASSSWASWASRFPTS
jgi:hypothetical protein